MGGAMLNQCLAHLHQIHTLIWLKVSGG